jgi:hypothetical protein
MRYLGIRINRLQFASAFIEAKYMIVYDRKFVALNMWHGAGIYDPAVKPHGSEQNHNSEKPAFLQISFHGFTLGLAACIDATTDCVSSSAL